VRERLVSQRTGFINQIRAFLLERGIAVRQGQRFLRLGKAGYIEARPFTANAVIASMGVDRSALPDCDSSQLHQVN
jgi:hypothetical protein